MAKQKKKFGNKRFFLNPKDGVAAASFNVEAGFDDGGVKGGWPSLEVESNLSMSDCNRQISLDFDLWLGDDKRDALQTIKERRAKLARFKQIVDRFVEDTTAAYEFAEEHLDDYIKARKAYAANKKKKKQ